MFLKFLVFTNINSVNSIDCQNHDIVVFKY